MQVTVTNEQLCTYEYNHLALYWTPGASHPYWASSANFLHDVCVATPRDFIEAAGYTTFEGMDDPVIAEETLSLEVALPENDETRMD